MAIKNKVVEKIFDDLDQYRDWCRFEGKVFDEKALYNRRDPVWNQYERSLKQQNRNQKAPRRQ